MGFLDWLFGVFGLGGRRVEMGHPHPRGAQPPPEPPEPEAEPPPLPPPAIIDAVVPEPVIAIPKPEWPSVKGAAADWCGIIGHAFDPATFDAYCRSLKFDGWRPSFIAVHNTAIPDLALRPNGFTAKHIENLVGYYRNEQRNDKGKVVKKKWSAGPHLFIDDRQIWVFTPLTVQGVHSPSWNSTALGVEMLGDYEKDLFDSGRGLQVRRNCVAALASLCGTLGFAPETLRFHKEDTKTTHDTCPGKHVVKAEIIAEVKARMAERGAAPVA